MMLRINELPDHNDHPDLLNLVYDTAAKALEGDGQKHLLEIGTCNGASAVAIMQAMADSKSVKPILVTVDPWGDKFYPESGSRYGDQHQVQALYQMARTAYEFNLRWHHVKATSFEFFTQIQDTTLRYGGQVHTPHWNFAFLDGEHVWDTVGREFNWVLDANPGAMVVVDNINHQPGGMPDKLRADCAKRGMAVKFYDLPDCDSVALVTKDVE